MAFWMRLPLPYGFSVMVLRWTIGLFSDLWPWLSLLKPFRDWSTFSRKIGSKEFMGRIQDLNSISSDGHRKSQFLTSFKKNSVQCYKEMSIYNVIQSWISIYSRLLLNFTYSKTVRRQKRVERSTPFYFYKVFSLAVEEIGIETLEDCQDQIQLYLNYLSAYLLCWGTDKGWR